MKNFTCLVLLLLGLNLSAKTGSDVVIYPESRYGHTLKYLIMDLKLSAGAIGGTAKAQRFFDEYDMNGVRVSIYGNDGHRYHPEAGTVLYDATAKTGYFKLVRSINYAQTARGEKDFVVFASKKLKGELTWPDWVLDGDGPEIQTDKYVTMLYDYVSFMKTHDIEIDVMGVDNEERWNKADMNPQQYKDIIDQLTVKLNVGGYKIPTWMGYEDYDPDMRNWVATLMNNGWQDYMEIYGVHYYPSTRKLTQLKNDLNKIGDIPFWSTEAHWSSKSGQDELATAEIGMATLWDQTDVGLDGLCMWDFLSNETNYRFNLVKQAMLPLKDAQPIFTDDWDGISIAASNYGKQLFTRSFIEDSLLTVYAINMTAEAMERQVFTLNYGVIDGEVSYVQFTDDAPVTGNNGTAVKSGTNQQYMLDLPSRSITCFSFLIDPIDILKYECENLTYTSPTANSITLQNNDVAAGGQHLNLSATTTGKSILFDVEAPANNNYKLTLTGLTWSSFGKYSCEVKRADGTWQEMDGDIDMYDTNSGRASMTWESVPLLAGTNQVRFTSSEKGASNGYSGSFDYIVLEQSTSAAMTETDASNDISIFPNPLYSTLTVKGLVYGQECEIFNLQGQSILRTKKETIDLSDLSSGIYIFKAGKLSCPIIKY